MKKQRDDTTKLTMLGSQKTKYLYRHPTPKIFETFPYKWTGKRDTTISIAFPEFTSLCPKTGQPDFAEILIEYIPNELCVESKSLKLYFFAWREEGTFMETIVNTICDDLASVLKPKWLKVTGNFNPRGGLKLVPTAEYREPAHFGVSTTWHHGPLSQLLDRLHREGQIKDGRIVTASLKGPCMGRKSKVTIVDDPRLIMKGVCPDADRHCQWQDPSTAPATCTYPNRKAFGCAWKNAKKRTK